MADIEITVDSGTSKRLLTGGKYCDKNILVTATGGGGVEHTDGIAFLARSASYDWESTSEISGSLSCVAGGIVLAIVMHRDTISTPDGWNLLFYGAEINESGFSQWVSIFSKESENGTETFSSRIASSGRAQILMCLILNGSENVTISNVKYGTVGNASKYIIVEKETTGLTLHVAHRLVISTGSGMLFPEPDWIQVIGRNRLYVLPDIGPVTAYKVTSESNNNDMYISYFSVYIPFSDNGAISYDSNTDNAIYDLPNQTALNIITGVVS